MPRLAASHEAERRLILLKSAFREVAEKGFCWVRARITGEPGHGSMPRHDSAVTRLVVGSPDGAVKGTHGVVARDRAASVAH